MKPSVSGVLDNDRIVFPDVFRDRSRDVPIRPLDPVISIFTVLSLTEHLVSPVVGIAGTVSGLRQAAKTLAGYRTGGKDQGSS